MASKERFLTKFKSCELYRDSLAGLNPSRGVSGLNSIQGLFCKGVIALIRSLLTGDLFCCCESAQVCSTHHPAARSAVQSFPQEHFPSARSRSATD